MTKKTETALKAKKNTAKRKKRTKKTQWPLLPLRDVVVFPYMVMPLFVGRDKSVNAIKEAMDNDRMIVLGTQESPEIENVEPDQIFNTGTLSEILQLLKLPDGTYKILIEGHSRVSIDSYISSDDFFYIEGKKVTERKDDSLEIRALMRHVTNLFEDFIKLNNKIPVEIMTVILNSDDPARLADIITAHLNLTVELKQKLLSLFNVKKRLELLCEIIAKEIEILELEHRIKGRVRKQVDQIQKEYYLREQLKAIHKELGSENEMSLEVEEYRQKAEKAKLPEYVVEKFEKELDRLSKMPQGTAEATVVRTYLDWLIDLPWTKSSKDQGNIKRSERILEKDHYGLEKVKERILEFLAVRKLKEKMKGPILCLVGPPGVGKTSLGRSIARALNREFVRMSLGGIRDEAEIRGHRRTYVGAMPGRIIQQLKRAKTNNPVFLLDEVDKLSSDFRGDPSSALLEVLDPEQNSTFMDNYLELSFDLSNIMFVTTANTLSIQPALLDRMEVIRIPGYTEEEKKAIASKYLVPKECEENGLTKENIKFLTSSLIELIRYYTREAGVRSLDKRIGSICRKTARKVVESKGDHFVKVTKDNVSDFLGARKNTYGEIQKKDEVGIANGLAWTAVGGTVLPVEVLSLHGKGKLVLTGKLGDVMQESAKAALSYVRSISDTLNIDESIYEKNDIHIHVPEGAVPKDGPSAGITIATAILSMITKKPYDRHVAMTGEITLRGKVLPIGGVKEKVLAAHRFGLKKIILPAENEKDLEEIPDNVKSKLKFFFVDSFDEVPRIALKK